jgi:ABC-type Fe3+/spermidine/putrescine transport system ATPase subunit
MSQAAAAALRCRGLRVGYGGQAVLHGLDLDVAAAETVALLGPSGSGKTTLLHAIAGFLEPEAGEIQVDGRLVHGPRASVPAEQRNVGVVFQNYALWPHMTALQTVAYPLRRQRLPQADATERAMELLELMGVADLAARRPTELSGGEQQRVGVARALARRAGLVLLDEPTAHLDTPLRARLLAELSEQRRRSGTAALYATHDVGEALAVADRVAVLRGGRLVQVGPPRDVYERPADAWVAAMTGPASVLTVTVLGADREGLTLRIGDDRATLVLDGHGEADAGRSIRVLVRPDWASLGGDLRAVVRAVLYRGPHTDYRLSTPAGDLELREPGPPRAGVGDEVRWTLRRAWSLGSGTAPPEGATPRLGPG